MFSDLTGDDLFAELVMQRTSDSRNFVIVEGDGDISLIDRFLHVDNFTAVPANGKERARGAIGRSINDGFPGVYASLDRDWVDLLYDGIDHHIVVYTEYYDLDACVFFSSGVSGALASSFCSAGAYRSGMPGCGEREIWDDCIQIAFPVGVLRFISERDGLGWSLRDFPLAEALLRGSDEVDLDKLIEIAFKRSKGAVSVSNARQLIEREMAQISDRKRYCSGHDLAKAFAIIARRRWGSKAGADTVERSARAAISPEQFKNFGIYRDSARWAEGNHAEIWSFDWQN